MANSTLCDFSGQEIKIVLWGNCALRFNGNIICALGQTEPAIAIFVGTTVQEYDGASFFIDSSSLIYNTTFVFSSSGKSVQIFSF